jgi:hypothetical protein
MTTAPTAQTDAAPPAAGSASRTRVIASRVLVVLVSILAAVSLLAGYVRYQALDTATVQDTAGDLLANDAIRVQIAEDLVDQLYANVDVAAALRARLPEDQQRLAAPIAGVVRQVADRAAIRMLERPRIQAAWVQSVATAHAELLRLLDDRGVAIRTTGGDIILDLHPLLIQLGDQVALVGNLADRLPPDAGRIVLMKTDNLRTAQRVTHLLDVLAPVLWIITLALAALAVWLAAGRRRRTIRSLAIGAIVAGLLVLALRRIAGNHVVDSLTPAETSTDAVKAAWDILTSLLADGGRTLVGLGAVLLFGTWLAGDTESGRTSRRELAPLIARREIAYGAAAAFLLLLVWWGPTAQLRRVDFVVLAAILLGLGVWALRRLTLQEYPDAASQSPSLPFRHA